MLSRWAVGVERWAVLGLRAWGEGRGSAGPRHLVVGERGELEAMYFLRRQGYRFAERRWRAAELHGDVDLIGWDGDVLCFVEVKTRTRRDLFPAAWAVDEGKMRMLGRLSRAYVRTMPRREREEVTVRFDVVSVYLRGEEAACDVKRGAFAAEGQARLGIGA